MAVWIIPLATTSKIARIYMGFARSSPRSVLLSFSQSYIEHDLRKNKIVIHFFTNRLIFMN
jgi:hypothetical protein